MGLRRRCAALFTAACLILFPAACNTDRGADRRINFEMLSPPRSLDPQLAENDTELMLVRNTFEGLCRPGEDGNPVLALARSVDRSGNTYTFRLREDAAWNDGTPLTAHDAVFGLRRALLPETGAPFARRLYAVKNAEAVHKGQKKPSELGIRAADDRTVVIELGRDDPDFLAALALPVAMPCNEAFFRETKGRYGLSADTILNNGAFYVKFWEKSEYLHMHRNPEYRTRKVVPASVAVFFGRDAAYLPSRLDDGRTDAAFADSSAQLKLIEAGYEPKLIYNQTLCLILNPEHPLFAEAAVRKAFVDVLRDADLVGDSEHRLAAEGAVPPGYAVRGENYRETAAGVLPPWGDPAEAAQRFHRLAAERNLPVSASELWYPAGAKEPAGRMAQEWQRALGVVVNIAESGRDGLLRRVRTGDFAAALVAVAAADDRVKSFLEEIDGLLPSVSISAELNKLSAASSAEAYREGLIAAEKKLLKSDAFRPLLHDSVCYVQTRYTDGIVYGPGGGDIDLVGARKTD